MTIPRTLSEALTGELTDEEFAETEALMTGRRTQDTEDVVAQLRLLARGHKFDAAPVVTKAADLIQSLSDRIDVLEGALRRVEPYVDAIVCYASSMDEHEPNRIAVDVRAALHQEGIAPK